MSYLYDLFNVTNDFELNKILESLDLSYNDMINIDTISRHNNPIQFRQNELLEYLAGTTDGNYEKVKTQLSKVYKPRTLKESSGLNLNQVMELNQLVQLVAQKLDIEQCMTGVYNIIKTKANENIAKAFIGMVQQSSVNQSSLKFNTDLNIGGQNLAQVIYQLKNDIEMFVNSVERPKEEKEEVKENVQNFTSEDIHQQMIKESFSKYQEIITQLNNAVDDMADINLLQSVSDKVNELMSRVKNMNEANDLASLKSTIETKMNNLMGSKARIEECCLATQVAANACEEDTFNGLLDGVKPTVINITVNKEDNGILPCVDNCCAEPCCDCNDNCCCEPQCDYGDDCAAPIVQPMNFEPTAIDSPILRKPNSAEVTSAITALSSHTNDIKSDSRENNLENLQTINTLLGQISNYFNQLLGESVEYKRIDEGILGAVAGGLIGKKVGHPFIGAYAGHKIQDKFFGKKDKPKEKRAYVQRKVANKIDSEVLQELYDVIAENYGDDWLLDYDEVDFMDILDTINDFGNEIEGYDDSLRYEYAKALKEKWKEEHKEELDEETVYDHSWYEVEGQKYPKRTKNGVEGLPIKEGIKDMFKKDTRQYRIEYGTNGGWISKDMKYIKGDIMDALIVTGYKKAQKLCDKLEPKQKSEKGLLHIEEIKQYPEEKDFEKTYEFLDIMKKYINREITSEEIKKYLKDKKIYTDINDYLILYKPSKIKNEKELEETCSAGACCAASVATVPSKPKKAKPRKEKSFDVELFKESIQDDLPSTLTINGKKVAYKIVEGKGYLYIDNGIVKTLDKNVMLETVDDVYNDCLDIEVLEGFNAYDLQIIMEDYITPNDDSQQSTIITPAEKQKQQEDLDNQIKKTPDMKVGVVNDDNPNEIKQNQQIVGVDDSNINDKKYVVKDPMTGDVKIANFDQIKVLEKK